MTDLASDYASRIRLVRTIVEQLGPDRRDPHRFHEDRNKAVKDLDAIAAQVELDQVFARLPGHPAAERVACPTEPRTVPGPRGRPVQVVTKRARRPRAR